MKSGDKVPAGKYADVPLRVKTWGYIILVLAAALAHPIATKVFVAGIGFGTLFEVLRMYQRNRYRIVLPAILGVAQFFLLCAFPPVSYFLYALLLLGGLLLLFLGQKVSTKQLGGIALGGILALLLFPSLAFIRDSPAGLKALIFLLVVTEFNDVFQYLMGKAFGKRKITPRVSPNKTWAGFVGGVGLTLLLSTILGPLLLPYSTFATMLLGLILGIGGFFGDVFMSAFKRSTGVKDTGALLPGHGGLLDRMDSLIFNVPVFFAFISFY